MEGKAHLVLKSRFEHLLQKEKELDLKKNMVLYRNSLFLILISYLYFVLNNSAIERSWSTIVIIGVIWSALLAFSFSYLMLVNKKMGRAILQRGEGLSLYFTIIAYSFLMGVMMWYKGGFNKTFSVTMSAFTAIYLSLVPVEKKRYVLLINSIVLTFLLLIFIGGLQSYFTTWIGNVRVTSIFKEFLFSEGNAIGTFAVASVALSILSYISVNDDNHLKGIVILIRLNVLIGLLITIFAATRGPILAFVVLILIVFVADIYVNKGKRRLILSKKNLLPAISILILIVLSRESVMEFTKEYFLSISKYHTERIFESMRTLIWEEVLMEFIDSPHIFLYGTKTLMETIPFYHHGNPHNSYLAIVRCAGIFPLLFLFLGIFIAIKKSRKEVIFSTAVLCMLLTRAFFDSSMIWDNAYDFFVFWAMLSIRKNVGCRFD